MFVGLAASDSDGLLHVLNRMLSSIKTRANDVANWPNPFQGLNPTTFQDSKSDWLDLIDGSSNIENVPYGPLLVHARAVDVIVTIEGSSDDLNNWPKYVNVVHLVSKVVPTDHLFSGTSLLFTRARQATLLRNSHQPFPPIPATPEEFIATGVNLRPTFFGCDPQSPGDYPLVIYLPNAPPFNGEDPVTKCVLFSTGSIPR